MTPSSSKRSEERIRELREEAGTVFLVSHNIDVDPGHLRPGDLAGEGRAADGRPTEEVLAAYNKG